MAATSDEIGVSDPFHPTTRTSNFTLLEWWSSTNSRSVSTQDLKQMCIQVQYQQKSNVQKNIQGRFTSTEKFIGFFADAIAGSYVSQACQRSWCRTTWKSHRRTDMEKYIGNREYRRKTHRGTNLFMYSVQHGTCACDLLQTYFTPLKKLPTEGGFTM